MISLHDGARTRRATRDRRQRSAPSETFQRRGGPAPSKRDPATARCDPQKVRRRWRVLRSAATRSPPGFHTIPDRARKPAHLHPSSGALAPARRKIPRGRDRAAESRGPSLVSVRFSFLSAWPWRIFSLFSVLAAVSSREPSHALSDASATPLPRAAPSPEETRGGWSRVVRGNVRAGRRVPVGDSPRRTCPGSVGPFHCGPAWRATALRPRARAQRVLVGDRALETFKLYAIAPRAARGITFRARKRKGPGSNVPGPFVGCLLSLSGALRLVDRSRKRRPIFTDRSACYGPHLLLEFAQRNFESLFRRAHKVHLHAVQHFLRQIFQHVRLVLRRQNDFPNSGALRSQHFFLDSAHRQHDSGKRNLSSHRHARTNGPARQQAYQCRDHRHSRGRPILRYRARRHVNVDVLLAEEVRINSVAFSIGANPRERRSHGFLHHVAQVAGHRERLPAAHFARFDEDDVAAHRCPNQAHGNSRLLHPLFHFFFQMHFRNAQHFANHFGCDEQFVRLSLRQTPRLLAHQSADFALQVAHARFPRVVADEFVQSLIGEFDLLAQRQAVLFGLAGDQEHFRDVDFFLFRVAGKLDDLHAIAQRLWNRIEPVRRRDEEHFREIKQHVEVVIAERRILFRVEYFHQRRRRIPAEITAELVHLVEHQDGVHRLRTANALNDLTRQSADVGPPVPANFCFVMHSAQRNTHEFAAQRASDGFSKRCLADARRPDEAQDRSLHARLQFLHSQVIQNAFLDLHQVVVILIQNRLRVGNVDVLGPGSFVPGQRSHPFQIRARHHVFRGRRSHLRQALQFALAFLLGFRRHAAVFDLLAQFINFSLPVVGLAEFLLNRFHLFAQQEFTLALVHLLLHLIVNLVAQIQYFAFFGQFADQRFQVRLRFHARLDERRESQDFHHADALDSLQKRDYVSVGHAHHFVDFRQRPDAVQVGTGGRFDARVQLRHHSQNLLGSF